MRFEPVVSGCSIVMVGDFNPAIFHPSWLHEYGVEGDIAEDRTRVDVVHQDITSFKVDARSYTIRKGSFTVETRTAPWVAIADITRQIFGELLIHSPVQAFGINKMAHFDVQSREVRHDIGRQLAPIAPWGHFGMELEPDNNGLNVGLQSLTMRRKSKLEMAIVDTNVTIEPSDLLQGNSGISMVINFHHDLKDYEPKRGARPAVDLLMQ